MNRYRIKESSSVKLTVNGLPVHLNFRNVLDRVGGIKRCPVPGILDSYVTMKNIVVQLNQTQSGLKSAIDVKDLIDVF